MIKLIKQKLENQVVSLELAKRMKQLGFKQESLFYWYTNTGEVVYFDEPGAAETRQNPNFKDVILPAYSVAELGGMLRRALKKSSGLMIMGPRGYCKRTCQNIKNFKDEAENRAKLLIYLAETDLINPTKL